MLKFSVDISGFAFFLFSHSVPVVELASWLRDSIGDSTIMGDHRWAGTFGVNVDFVARSHCSVEMILLEDMKVCINIYIQIYSSILSVSVYFFFFVKKWIFLKFKMHFL